MSLKQSKRGSGIITVTSELKSKILDEILKEGSSIPAIAKSYNLSPKRLYNWRKQAKCLKSDVSGSGFVELRAIDVKSGKCFNISRVSLAINDISLSVDGDISSSALMKILEALGSC